MKGDATGNAAPLMEKEALRSSLWVNSSGNDTNLIVIKHSLTILITDKEAVGFYF